jgi:two-component system response regulator FixJ
MAVVLHSILRCRKGGKMTETNATVFIVDDDQAILESMRMLIETVGMSVQTFSSGTDFLESYDAAAGCVILDVRMPGMSGLELQAEILKRKMDIPVIFVTGYGDIPMAVQAITAGAVDFIEKPFRDQVLLDAINKAIRKDSKQRRSMQGRRDFEERCKLLTAREQQVMDLLMVGKSSKKIAVELNISTKTVDFHRQHLMDKMAVDSIVKLLQLKTGAVDTRKR